MGTFKAFGLVAACVSVLAMTGCGGTVGSTVAAPSSPVTIPAGVITGNWQMSFTTGSGAQIFPLLTGFVQESYNDPTDSKYTYAEMTATSTVPCFAGTNSIFFVGGITSSTRALSVYSQSVNYQSISLTGTFPTDDTVNGTYSISAGCGDGAKGSFTGFRVARVLGIYSGAVDGTSKTMQISLTQNIQGNGNGNFQFGGDAAFTGFGCFTHGTPIMQYSYVTGTAIQLTLSTNDGGQIALVGTVDQGATTITVKSITITGDSCAGSLGTATLKIA